MRPAKLRFEYCGEMLTLRELGILTGIPPARLYQRIVVDKWAIDRAVSERKHNASEAGKRAAKIPHIRPRGGM